MRTQFARIHPNRQHEPRQQPHFSNRHKMTNQQACGSQWFSGSNNINGGELTPNTADNIIHQDQVSSRKKQQQQQQQQQPASQQLAANDMERPKRNPFCSRCRNHGKSAQVKGHKRHCEYRDCQCEGCKLVQCRQIVSAAQIRRRRYQKQDEECGRRIEVSGPVLAANSSNDPASSLFSAAWAASSSTPPRLVTKSSNPASSIFGAAWAASEPPPPPALLTKTNNPASSLFGAAWAAMSPAPPTSFPSKAKASCAEMQPPAGMAAAAAAALLMSSGGRPYGPVPLLEVREQLALVEELHESYGPLVAFAWLREEQFNATKVRNLIELARDAFEDLLHVDESPILSPIDLTSPQVD